MARSNLILVKAAEQVLLPSCACGVDWGVQRRVLLANGRRFLGIVPGSSTWNGRGMPRRYVTTSYRLFEGNGDRDLGQVLWDGRFSKRTLNSLSQIVADFLSIPREVVLAVDPKETYMVFDLE